MSLLTVEKRDRSDFDRLSQNTARRCSVPCPPTASGRFRSGQLSGSIGILEALEKPMPIGRP